MLRDLSTTHDTTCLTRPPECRPTPYGFRQTGIDKSIGQHATEFVLSKFGRAEISLDGHVVRFGEYVQNAAYEYTAPLVSRLI